MKILVIEDNPKHMKDVRKFFFKISDVETIFTSDLGEAENLLYEDIDGVITDLFFDPDTDPNGLLVKVMCIKDHDNLPCVICTSGYHHGSKYTFANRLISRMGWDAMIDSENHDNPNDEAGTKNWAKAWEILKYFITRSHAIKASAKLSS